MLLFLARLYGQQLQLSDTTIVSIWMTHGGLAGRHLTAIGSRRLRNIGACAEEKIETELTTVAELESRLVENVMVLLAPVFTLFDFAEIAEPIWAEIIERFVAGEIS